MLRRMRTSPMSAPPGLVSGRGFFLGIGLNRLDPSHYGTDGLLRGAEQDVLDMESLSRREGFSSFKGTPLLSGEATRKSVAFGLASLASLAAPGDLVWIHYSGHGGQVPDYSGDEADDALDETWCLYDGQYLDDELHAALATFRAGVKVLMVSDSCHSGTVARALMTAQAMNIASQELPHVLPADLVGAIPTYRTLEPAVLRAVADVNEAFYKGIALAAGPVRESGPLAADVAVLSACQDNQLALDGPTNGLFTGRLLAALKRSRGWKSYRTLLKAVSALMPPTQTPSLDVLGPGHLADSRPFLLGGLASDRASV